MPTPRQARARPQAIAPPISGPASPSFDAADVWAALADHTSAIVTITDRDGRVRYANRAQPPLAPEGIVTMADGKLVSEVLRQEIAAHIKEKEIPPE